MSNSHTKKVICIGEAMLELSLGDSSDAQVNFAGDTLNTAIYLKRLCGDTADVSYCTVVGQDALSARLVQFIQSENVNTNTIHRVNDRTIGLYAIATDDRGERTFTYWRNQSAARQLFQTDGAADFSALSQFDIVYLSAITLAILPAQIRQTLLEELTALRAQQNTLVAFDSNYRPALWEEESVAQSTIESFWKITDIALPSIDDEQALFKDTDEQSVLQRFSAYGAARGAMKRGELGPLSLGDHPGELPAQYLTAVEVIDSTAAGDSFNAGYLSAVLQGLSQTEALQHGHNCASRVITKRGAIIPKAIW